MGRFRLAVICGGYLVVGVLIGILIMRYSGADKRRAGDAEKNAGVLAKSVAHAVTRSTQSSSPTGVVSKGRKSHALSRSTATKTLAGTAQEASSQSSPPSVPQMPSDGLPVSENTASNDSSGFRGPNGNGTYLDGKIRTNWNEKAPRILWSANIGYGFSGVVVAGKKVITAGYERDKNMTLLVCFDADSGNILWQTEYADSLAGPRGGLCGPVATPAISGDKVYMVATAGAAYCFDLNTGVKVWNKVMNKEGAMCGEFGDGASPVVYGDTVIVHLSTGAKAASWFALKKSDGSVVWSLPVNSKLGADDPLVDRSYSPVTICNVAGKPAALLISDTAIECVDAGNGTKSWSFSTSDLAMRYGPFAEAVFFAPDKFLLETWYASKANVIAYQVTETGLIQLWTSKAIGRGAYSCVVFDGMAFGYGVQGLNCMDLSNGRSNWRWRSSDPKMARDQGEIILVGDKLVWVSSFGMLYIGNATADKSQPLGEFKALKACDKDLKRDTARCNNVVSTSPTFARGRIYVRSSWGEIACVDFN
jgi:outer membrane protein assembly factor BamB